MEVGRFSHISGALVVVATVTEAAGRDAVPDEALLLSSRRRLTSLAKRFLLWNDVCFRGIAGEERRRQTNNITLNVLSTIKLVICTIFLTKQT